MDFTLGFAVGMGLVSLCWLSCLAIDRKRGKTSEPQPITLVGDWRSDSPSAWQKRFEAKDRGE